MSYLSVSSYQFLKGIALLVQRNELESACSQLDTYQASVVGRAENPASLLGRISASISVFAGEPKRRELSIYRTIFAKRIEEHVETYPFILFAETYKQEKELYHFPVILQIQQYTCGISYYVLGEDNYVGFLSKDFIPALELFYRTGSTENLEKSLNSLIHATSPKNVKEPVQLMLCMLKTPALLWKPIGTFLPDLHVDTKPLAQKELVDHLRKMRDYYRNFVVATDPMQVLKMQQALLNAFQPSASNQPINFEGVSSLFRYCLRQIQKTFRMRTIALHQDYERAAGFLLETSRQMDFLQVQEHVEFLQQNASSLKELNTLWRDGDLMVRVCDLKELEKAWKDARAKAPHYDFYQFFCEKSAEFRLRVLDSRAPECMRALSFLQKNAPAKSFQSHTAEFSQTLTRCLSWLNGLFYASLRAGEMLHMHRAETPVPKRTSLESKADHKRSAQTPSVTFVEAEEIEVISSEVSTMSLQAGVSLSPTAQILAQLLDSLPKDPKNIAKTSLLECRWHYENACQILERVVQQRENPRAAVTLFMKEGARTLEQLLKAQRELASLKPVKEAHDLFKLAEGLSFIDRSHELLFMRFNYAEMATRDLALFSGQRGLSPAQFFLDKVYSSNFETYRKDFFRILESFFQGILSIGSKGKPQARATNQMSLLVQECVALLKTPASPREALQTRLPGLLQEVQRLDEVLSPLSKTDSTKYVKNLRENFLACFANQARFEPNKQGFRSHFSTIFELVFLITEDLLTFALVQKGVDKDPIEFRHNLVEMLKATKLPKSAFTKDQLLFLERAPDYLHLRFLAAGRIRDSYVQKIAGHILNIQDTQASFEAPTAGFSFDQDSASAQLHTLIQEAEKECRMLQEFAQSLIKLLDS
jgi:hypothetical protein